MVFRTLSFTTSSGDSHSTRALLYRVLTCEPRTQQRRHSTCPCILQLLFGTHHNLRAGEGRKADVACYYELEGRGRVVAIFHVDSSIPGAWGIVRWQSVVRTQAGTPTGANRGSHRPDAEGNNTEPLP